MNSCFYPDFSNACSSWYICNLAYVNCVARKTILSIFYTVIWKNLETSPFSPFSRTLGYKIFLHHCTYCNWTYQPTETVAAKHMTGVLLLIFNCAGHFIHACQWGSEKRLTLKISAWKTLHDGQFTSSTQLIKTNYQY